MLVTLHPALDASAMGRKRRDDAETRAITIIPKAAGFDTAEIRAPKLVASAGAVFKQLLFERDGELEW
eukprot:scaffold8145_cov54-Attheya_sp.AAC.4